MADRATIARPYARAAFAHAQATKDFANWSKLLDAAAGAAQDPRVARRNQSRGTQIGRSEQLAAAVYPAWLRHRGMTPDVHHERGPGGAADLGARELGEVFTDLDRLSAQWSGLAVGESVDVDWPWPERR